MDAPRRYIEELRGELGFYPMWMPGDPIALGTFGTFERGVLRKEGRLGDLGIDFAVETPATKSSFKKQRGMRFGVSSSASAEAGVIDASAGVTVSVDSAYSWAFGAVGARKTEIADVLQVQTAVLAARRTGLWKDEYLLVSEVYEVDTLNVLIATSKNASGMIKAKGKIATAEHILLAEDASYRFDASDVFVGTEPSGLHRYMACEGCAASSARASRQSMAVIRRRRSRRSSEPRTHRCFRSGQPPAGSVGRERLRHRSAVSATVSSRDAPGQKSV
jgi:hypothetical protein